MSPNLQLLRATPALDKVRSTVQAQLEASQMSKSFTIQAERESPGLSRLRQTPGMMSVFQHVAKLGGML